MRSIYIYDISSLRVKHGSETKMQVRVFLDSQTLVDTAIHSLDTSGISNPIAECSNKEDLNHKFIDVHFMGGIY